MTNPVVTTKRIRPCPKSALSEERGVFMKAFASSYASLPDGALRLPSDKTLQAFLGEAFDEEVAAFRSAAQSNGSEQTKVLFYRADVVHEGREVAAGYLSVDVMNEGRELYMRQLAVSPDFQKMGVARKLTSFAIEDVPGVHTVSVSCRRTNSSGLAFYESLGFSANAACHHSLNPNVYAGMVKKLAC